MGITVNESYTTPAGFDVPSYYVSLGDSRIELSRPFPMPVPRSEEQPARKYSIQGTFNIWVSKAARQENRSMIGSKNIYIERETPITENVYDVLYAKLKEGFSNYTEDI